MDDGSLIHPLIADGLLDQPSFKRAETLARQKRSPIELVANQLGLLSDRKLTHFYQIQTGLKIIDPPTENAMPDVEARFNLEFLKHHQVLILSETFSTLSVAMVNPTDSSALSALQFASGKTVQPSILEVAKWRQAWTLWFETELVADEDEIPSSQSEDVTQRDSPIVRKVSGWIETAADLGASDIHFEAKAHGLDVLYRIDGRLKQVASEPSALAPALLSRLKVLSDLDLGIRHRPQDGRASIVTRGRNLDIRVSLVPSIYGESAVLRLLDKPDGFLDFDALGFDARQKDLLSSVTSAREGLFLVAGPTGSGKTTTLYACLETFKGSGLKILSVEDPIEYRFDHVTQVQVSEKAGLGFADVLRSFLRHDPEVIFVGEIRDGETADMAVQAAFTGHLVLASIHAIDADKVIDRLEGMGVDRGKLEACLIGSMNQRLVRQLCPHCKTEIPLDDHAKSVFLNEGLGAPEKLYEASSCSVCDYTGFKGRRVVSAIQYGADETARSLIGEGLPLVAEGIIPLSEILPFKPT